MTNYINSLEIEFEKKANPIIASKQKLYMRNQFEYYGMTTNIRRDVSKKFLQKDYLPVKNDLEKLVKKLWNKPERDYHLFAQELVFKYKKQFEKTDIILLEFMITNKSWWDTVDYIAPKLIGDYFKKFPEQRDKYIAKWLAIDNIWLHRSALLFQLKWKNTLDVDFISYVINNLLGSKEFFINKAIAWILREYSRTNPEWVIDFVGKTKLSALSKREALKLLK